MNHEIEYNTLKVENTSDKENKIVEIRINVPGDDLMVKKTGKTIAELREERGYKVYKANESETVKRLVAPSREGVSTGFKSFVKMPRVVSDSDAAFNSIMGEKENLAGKQGLGNANVLKSLIKGGTVTLNINAPAGVVKDYDDTQSTGVKVNLGSTTGQKSYKNGY